MLFPARKIAIVDYRISIEFPENLCGKLETRSSIAKMGLTHLGGIIDSDYRGSIAGIVQNMTEHDVILKRGQRLGQLVFLHLARPRLLAADMLNETSRGAQGFGSTGNSHPDVHVYPEPIEYD